MRSERWTGDPDKSKTCLRGQPYILPSGHISGSVYLTWRCSAHQWFATTVRSVISHITKRDVVKKRCKRKKRNHLTMIAILYVCTNDDNLLERLLNCRAQDFVRVFCHYLNNVDENPRFLYDQAVSAASWFELRGGNPRVQSTKKTILAKYRMFGLKTYDTRRGRRDEVQALSDPWIVQNEHFTKGMNFLAA